MAHKFTEIAFTETVRKLQSDMGSRKAYDRFDGPDEMNGQFSTEEAAFIAQRDSFYMATVSETGWPYVQHRGGPAGFLKVLDEKTLGFADFRGNRQYVSLGNLQGDNRVSLFLMDYANRRRLKLLGRVEVTEDPAILEELTVPGYRAKVERGILIHIEGFDWNCPQHITRRFTEDQVRAAIAPLQERIADLEGRLEALGEPA